jgi:hypothetical protein
MRRLILIAAIATALVATSPQAEAGRRAKRSKPPADPAAAFLMSCTTLNFWQIGQRCVMQRKVCTIISMIDDDMEIRCR